jgi:hypothetical protein
MKVKELIEVLKTMDQDAPVVVHGFFGGFDDAEFITPVSLAAGVYKNETWRGKHELLETLRRYAHKAISSRTISSELRRFIVAVEKGTAKIDLMTAVCLAGESSLQMSQMPDEDTDEDTD